MSLGIFVPKNSVLGKGFTERQKAEAAEHPGRRTRTHGYQSPAEWITQLVSLRKPVILCSNDRRHFDPKKYRYRRFYCLDAMGGNGYVTNGKCDHCKEDTRLIPGGGTMFIAEEYYQAICMEPGQAQRAARQRWKLAAQTVWRAINPS